MTEQFDMAGLLAQAQAMQERLAAAQEQAAGTSVEGQAGGGAVRVTLTGDLVVTAVSIDPRAVDPDDVPMLEDLLLAACNDAIEQAKELSRDAVGDIELGLGGGLLGGLN
ncbi:MAG: YbaB/EbfC family nucleoid-associated protein [Acidimicrobiales bacterium]